MKKLVRSTTNRMIAGICGGLGEYFRVDATLIRIALVALVIFSFGSLVLAYLIAMLVIPLEGK